MNDYSRDETEFGAFEDPAACAAGRRGTQGCFVGVSPMLFPAVVVGSIFDRIAKPFIGKTKKKLDANVRTQLAAQGATPAQLALLQHTQESMHIHAADVAKGIATSAKVGLAVASFVVPGGAVAGTAALGGLVAADKLVAAGQRGVAAAKTTIDTTKHLAAAGHIDAQRGLQAIGLASAERAAKGIPAGVEQKVTAAGHAAYTSFLSARKPVVVMPVAAAPKSATPPKLPAIHSPAAPPRPAAAIPARAPIAPVYVPPRPPAVVARPPAPPPVTAPKPAAPMTAAGLQMLANTLSSAVHAGKLSPSSANAMIDRAIATMPVNAANTAAIVAARARIAAAAGPSSGITAAVLPAPAPVARDWLVTDDGKVQRIVRGNAIQVSGRGWYVGQFGLQRIGA